MCADRRVLTDKKGDPLEFFDPYGFKPDTQQCELAQGIDNRAYEQHDHELTRLLKESGHKVFYNSSVPSDVCLLGNVANPPSCTLLW